jgi:hypothetical protein
MTDYLKLAEEYQLIKHKITDEEREELQRELLLTFDLNQYVNYIRDNYSEKSKSLSNKLNNKEYFLLACFAEDLQEFYKMYIAQKPSRIQNFQIINKDKGKPKLSHLLWSPSNECTYTKNILQTKEVLTKDTIDVQIGYWTPVWLSVHKDFKQLSMDINAYECQKIDTSCNDCSFLNRKESWCTKFNRKTIIQANMCQPQNQDCFLHRKDSKL